VDIDRVRGDPDDTRSERRELGPAVVHVAGLCRAARGPVGGVRGEETSTASPDPALRRRCGRCRGGSGITVDGRIEVGVFTALFSPTSGDRFVLAGVPMERWADLAR
jgi:hypothetical protein